METGTITIQAQTNVEELKQLAKELQAAINKINDFELKVTYPKQIQSVE